MFSMCSGWTCCLITAFRGDACLVFVAVGTESPTEITTNDNECEESEPARLNHEAAVSQTRERVAEAQVLPRSHTLALLLLHPGICVTEAFPQKNNGGFDVRNLYIVVYFSF